MSSFCFLDAVGRPLLYDSKRSFYFFIFGNSLFLNHSPSEWFYITKRGGISLPPLNKFLKTLQCNILCNLQKIHVYRLFHAQGFQNIVVGYLSVFGHYNAVANPSTTTATIKTPDPINSHITGPAILSSPA